MKFTSLTCLTAVAALKTQCTENSEGKDLQHFPWKHMPICSKDASENLNLAPLKHHRWGIGKPIQSFMLPQCQTKKIRGLVGLCTMAVFPFKIFVRVGAVQNGKING